MDQTRPCGCKGRRSCLICEEKYGIQPTFALSPIDKENGYTYCHLCGLAWQGWDENYNVHPHHKGDNFVLHGIYVLYNFLSDYEKDKLLDGIDRHEWTLSQSGRRKQNYGPKCNFKKAKIQKGNFCGFPEYSRFVHEKFKSVTILNDFHTIEQCVLEYDPKRGASIDPHIDDCWIWGERIVTVNVLGEAVLTLTKYKGEKTKYNLNYVASYKSGLINEGTSNSNNIGTDVKIRIFMPEKSLIVLFGDARYEWEHSVLREDVKNYRICIAYREFTPMYLSGEFKSIGEDIMLSAQNYW